LSQRGAEKVLNLDRIGVSYDKLPGAGEPLLWPGDWTYLVVNGGRGKAMPELASDHVRPRTVVLFSSGVAALFAVALTLWAYYGTALFFEMLRAGWAACF
jgi:hypothetical protein